MPTKAPPSRVTLDFTQTLFFSPFGDRPRPEFASCSRQLAVLKDASEQP
jgi:hypothetical protein